MGRNLWGATYDNFVGGRGRSRRGATYGRNLWQLRREARAQSMGRNLWDATYGNFVGGRDNGPNTLEEK